MPKRKLLFYCQYLTGLGHLVRSTELAAELARRFDVHFINGGPELDGFAPPAGVSLERLPALWLEDGEYRVSARGSTVAGVKAARTRRLVDLVRSVRPDCVVTEFFPFGRHKLLFELEPFLQNIREVVPHSRVVCSVRDIIGRATVPSETPIIRRLVNQYYDLILHHSDPRFLDFASAYHDHAQLNCPAVSTGFVARSHDASAGREQLPKGPYIVASVGGGRLGFELLRDTILAHRVAPTVRSYDLVMFTGPFMPGTRVQELHRLADNHPRIAIRRFAPNLGELMSGAALSISLAGYNTTMDVLRTGVPAIVVPYGHYDQDHEQRQRTDLLTQQGVLDTIHPAALSTKTLADKMTCLLERGSSPGGPNRREPATPRISYRLDGARHSARVLSEMFPKTFTSVGTGTPCYEAPPW